MSNANEASKPAPSVEQDERGALDVSVIARLSAQIFDCPLNPTISKFARAVEANIRAASTSANVAQGAEAVLSDAIGAVEKAGYKVVPVTDWVALAKIGVHQNSASAMSDNIAPPAQTATTDEQEARVTDLRHSLEETQSLLAAMLHEQRPREEIEEQMVANRRSLSLFLTAAQSASGDTK